MAKNETISSTTNWLSDSWIVVALFLCVAIISRLGFLSAPFQNDAGIYIYMGKVLAQGGQLYRDFYETKLPTVALVTAPLYATFGANWFAYALLQLVVAMSAAFLM